MSLWFYLICAIMLGTKCGKVFLQWWIIILQRARASTSQHNQGPASLFTASGEHRFLVFTQHPRKDREGLRAIWQDVEDLKNRHVEVGRTLDWNLLDQYGARETIDSYLTQEFHDGNRSFSCNACWRALNLREPIFMELVIEFIASYEFDEEEARKDTAPRPIRYRLGGQWQEISIINLAGHLGLYTDDEVRHRRFLPFLDHCDLWKSDQTNLSDIWSNLGIGPFSASNTKVS